MKRLQRITAWITLALLVGSAVWLAVCAAVSREDLTYVAIICGALSFSALAILISVCAVDAVRYHLEQEGIRKTWAGLTVKRIPYGRIGCITVSGAIHHYGYTPVLDKDKKPCAALVLHADDIYHAFTSKQRHFLYAGQCGVLYQERLDVAVLEELLTRASAPVYITASMLAVHEQTLRALVSRFADRVFVAYYDVRREHERKLPYEEYILYKKEIDQ